MTMPADVRESIITRPQVQAREGAGGAGGAVKIDAEDLNFYYGEKKALENISIRIRANLVTAFIGPSGCGKSTFLRTLNRMNDIIPGTRVEGRVCLDGRDIYAPGTDVVALRQRVGMVFQKPNPFPKSIRENLAFPLRINGIRDGVEQRIETALRRAGLYEEVADDLDHPALRLSGGQQQRLCIARALAVQPEVLLLDEPCSALDPRSTATIEDLMVSLRRELAVVIVTHNLQQAYRIADYVAFMYLGELVEYGPAEQVFGDPRAERTRDYVSGAFG